MIESKVMDGLFFRLMRIGKKAKPAPLGERVHEEKPLSTLAFVKPGADLSLVCLEFREVLSFAFKPSYRFISFPRLLADQHFVGEEESDCNS